jgi:competence protein ComZ
MNQDKSLVFMQIGMKYLPEAKEKLKELGIELSMEMIEPLFGLLNKVMDEAYQSGFNDAIKEVEKV